MKYIIPIIIQILLIAANAIFAAAEIAVISVNSAKLEKMQEDGNKKAKKLLNLTRNSSKFLSTYYRLYARYKKRPSQRGFEGIKT